MLSTCCYDVIEFEYKYINILLVILRGVENEMPTVTYRKLIRFGKGGFVVTVPPSWTRYYDLSPGDKLEVIANDELTIRPVRKKESTNKHIK